MAIVLAVLLVFIAVVGVGVFFGAPFVPTRQIWIDDALDLAKISRDDIVVDLGSGSGAVLAAALQRGAKRAVGYEINPLLVAWSRLKLRKFRGRAKIVNRNFFAEKLPRDTTVIYLFQVDKVMRKIPKFIERQRPNLTAKKLRVVCFGFTLPGRKAARQLNGMTLYEF